ncbi:hypothetical protein [Natronorubrum thiooxidans]|nr:hypothetical protein [Natronorubrum thiooxidans]
MDLSQSLVESTADEYRDEHPLYPVEQEGVETLPTAFRTGEFGWRDAKWVVRWHYRRFLGAIPNATRREREAQFDRNDFEDIRDALIDVATADDPVTHIDRLTALEGVDVPVASAFLLFVGPESCLVVGEREWTVLYDAGELADPYPDPLSPAAYDRYLETCRSLGERFDCDMWTLYRALWQLGASARDAP